MFTALLALAATQQVQPAHLKRVAGGFEISVEARAAALKGIENERLLTFPGSATRVLLWSERGVDKYAIATDGINVNKIAEGSQDILLKFGNFDPKRSVPAPPPGLDANASNQVFIVQFETQVLPEYLQTLKEAGAALSYYLPNNAYIVEMNGTAYDRVAALPFVRWVGVYQPAYRLETDLENALLASRVGTQRYNIQTYHYGPAQKNQLVKRILAIGGRIDQNVPEGYTIQATLSPNQLAEVAKFNEVFFIDVWSPIEQDMNIVRDISGANYIETIGNYKGQGVRGQVRDGGVRATHQAFTTGHPLVVRANTTDTSHGSSTTGIVFGNGTGNTSGRGMLPEGQGIFLSGLSTGATRYNETLALLSAPYFAVFESNSTGSSLTTAYGTESFTMDDILFRMNILICQSQSNAGSQQSRPQAWAKNIVSVGGIKHQNTLTTADDNWTNGGSIGPAQDGRIKPDLAHFYDSVLCTTNTSDTAYTTGFGGTSAATPITCGHFGLLFQMWADGVFGNSVLASTVFDARPWNTTARALMINTASQWPFTGTTADLTRTHQGWGRADVRSMYDLRNNLFVVNESSRLQAFQKSTYRVYVPAGQPAFRSTMIFTDPPGTTSASQHRINDLTLKVTSPSGTFYYGNNGLLAGNWSTSGGAPNTIDVVENVFVQNPEAGVWIVEVSADQINQDAELSTPAMDADFALVCSNVIAEAGPTSFSVTDATINSGGLAELQTSNNQVLSVNRTLLTGPRVDVTGTAPNTPLTSLTLKFESNSPSTGPAVNVYFWNYVTNAWTLVGSSLITATDTVVSIPVTSNVNDFVDPATKEIKARLGYTTTSRTTRTLGVTIDQIRWIFGV